MRNVFVLAATAAVVGLSLVLGATVFQEQVASAAKEIQSVVVANTAADPVPVAATGTVPVHEQGTVTVTGTVTVPDRTIVQYSGAVFFDDGSHNGNSTALLDIPDGKTLVAQYVSVRETPLTAGADLPDSPALEDGTGTGGAGIFVPLRRLVAAGTAAGSEQTQALFPQAAWNFFRSSATGEVRVDWEVSGYLIG